MKKALLLFLLLCILPLGGCGEAREINDTAIISGAAFDLDKETGAWKVTAQVVNREAEPGTQAPPLILDATGISPEEALANLEFKSSRKILLSHARVFILSKEAAEAGISPLIDLILKNNSLRLSTELLVAGTETAAQVWELKTDATDFIGFDLDDMIHEAREWGNVPGLKAYQAKTILETEDMDPLIPLIGKDERGNAAIIGAAVFLGDKMVGRITKEETEGSCK